MTLWECVWCFQGYDNPIFACIELDYSDADQDDTGEAAHECNKMLTFYELDLGLNHVVRKAIYVYVYVYVCVHKYIRRASQ